MTENGSVGEKNLAADRVLIQFGANLCMHAEGRSLPDYRSGPKQECRCNMGGALILWTVNEDEAEALYGALRGALETLLLQQPASRS